MMISKRDQSFLSGVKKDGIIKSSTTIVNCKLMIDCDFALLYHQKSLLSRILMLWYPNHIIICVLLHEVDSNLT
jgi:hypothetical protein